MKRKLIFKKFSVFFLILFLLPAVCLSDEVSEPVAHLVAQNYLAHYVAVNGKWAGSDDPRIIDSELIEYRDMPVAYNFKVHPKGHLLIPCWDEFSPVFLYSTTSEFIPERVEDSPSIESWIIPEIYNVYKIITENRRTLEKTIVYSDTRVAKAWEWLNETGRHFSSKAEGYDYKFATVAPLLTTIWTQESPYNQYCPGVSGTCDNSLVGCVATAWSQLMKYWEWPTTGTGSHSYEWNGQTLSADFNHEYYWSLMPSQLTTSSTSAQKDAVARLCSDVGIAADMNYGCDESGSNAFANDILDMYFKYKTSMEKLSRRNFTAAQWFALFKAEFDASPGRPIVFSIYGVNGGGHETVADGYETGATDKVHVNFGWAGSYDGYYDVTNNFTTGYSTWRGDYQFIVTHIEPDYSSTTIYVDPSGSCGGNTPCYTTVQAAVNAASTGTSIKIVQGNYNENVVLSTSKQVTLSGGWNSSYTTQSSTTSVNALTISNGGITVDNLVLETVSAQMPPTVTTGSATSVTSSSATLNGTVNPNGSSTTYYCQYGTSTSYGSSTASTSVASGTSDVSVDASISGLSSSTTYHFRLVATNSAGINYGSDRTFSTSASPITSPTVTTSSATSVSTSSATLNGTVNPNGASTTYYFQYGTTTYYGSFTSSTSAGSGSSSVSASASLTGLSSSTTYHFRLVAINSAGINYGSDQSFTTATPPKQIANIVFYNSLVCAGSSFTADLMIDGQVLTSATGVYSDCDEFDCGASLSWTLYATSPCGIILSGGSKIFDCDCLYKFELGLYEGSSAVYIYETCPGDCSDVSSAFTVSMQLLDSVVLTKDADLLGLTVLGPLMSK